jgi:hypothetical protein
MRPSKLNLWSLSALIVGWGLGAHAATATITATVSHKTVTVGEPFTLVVQLSTPPEKLTLPEVDGLRIGTPKTVVNQANQSERRIEYSCVAERAGVITLPPIVAEVGGSVITTKPIVLLAVGTPGQRTGSPAAGGRQDNSILANRAPTREDIMFLQATVDKTEVYQGEGLVFDLAWWRLRSHRVRIGRSDSLQTPAFEGFFAVRKPDHPTIEQARGFSYEVFHQQWVLYPTEVGRLVIPEARINAEFLVLDWGSRFEPFQMKTDPIEIHVKPLPTRPPNFSGAVGQYQFRLERSEITAAQGVPFLMIAKVIGQGNPHAIGEPHLPPVQWAQLSRPEKSLQELGAGVYSKTFAYKIMPLEGGVFSLPGLEFCYFDPNKAEYVTLTTAPISLAVADSPEMQHQMVHASDFGRQIENVSILAVGLFPLDLSPDRLRPQRFSAIALPTAAVAPVLAYAALVVLIQRKRRFAADTALARAYHARQRAQKKLARVTSAADPPEALYRATTQYLADCRNLPESGITYADAREMLATLPVQQATAEKMLKVMRACERHRYAGASLSKQELVALVHAAVEAVDEMDIVLHTEAAQS